VQGRLGQHRFLIELDLPRDPKVTARLWPALERITTAMHLLGEYPVAKVR
jgi:prephenate dehydratase